MKKSKYKRAVDHNLESIEGVLRDARCEASYCLECIEDFLVYHRNDSMLEDDEFCEAVYSHRYTDQLFALAELLHDKTQTLHQLTCSYLNERDKQDA